MIIDESIMVGIAIVGIGLVANSVIYKIVKGVLIDVTNVLEGVVELLDEVNVSLDDDQIDEEEIRNIRQKCVKVKESVEGFIPYVRSLKNMVRRRFDKVGFKK